MNEAKERFRKIYKAKRAQLTPALRERYSIEILNQFKSWISAHGDYNHFHLFLPIENQNEINTYIIKEFLEVCQKKVYTSKIERGHLKMETYLLDPATKFGEGNFGIPIPLEATKVERSSIEVVLVPLLAYDKVGNRIGYGKGFYDYFLSGLDKFVIKVGLSYFLPEEHLPVDPHDIPLDFCITPKKIITF
jgi:5-formyltetrahydrofolate cyclo-ligase